MKLRRYGLTGAAAALLATSGMASAQIYSIDPYIGAGVGQSRFDTSDSTLGLGSGGIDDDKDTAWRLFAGSRLGDFFGAELGFVDFGKITGNEGGTKAKARGVDLVAMGYLPVFAEGAHGFDLFAKAGGYWWDAYSTTLGTDPDIDSGDGFDWTAGVGVQYTFGGMTSGQFGVRAEWQRYNNVFDDVDNDVWMGSVMWQF